LKGVDMPIKGLSDRQEAFPEIGKIRKGAKKEPNKPGAELPYFRVEFADGEVLAESKFRAVYGDKPTAIRVVLPFNDIERVWDPWMEAWTAGRRMARSDGDYVEFLIDARGNLLVSNYQDPEGKRVPHPKDNIAGKDAKGNLVEYKPTGRLRVMVPEIERAAYLTVLTTSYNDVGNISSQLRGFKELNGGRLAGIPLILRRVPAMVSTPKADGSAVRRKKYLISVEVDPEWAKGKFSELNTLALPLGAGAVPAGELPAGVLESLPTDHDEDELEAEVTEAPETTPTESPSPSPEPPRMVDILGSEAVTYAAKSWACTNEQAAQELAKRKLGKSIAWDVFVETVRTVKAELTK
jgi:hypothetical protein